METRNIQADPSIVRKVASDYGLSSKTVRRGIQAALAEVKSSKQVKACFSPV